MQCVGVTKPLLSCRKMCRAGNRVVLDDDGSYIEHKESGNKTPIEMVNGTYAVKLWVAVPEATESVAGNNRWASLAPVDEEDETDEISFDPGFTGHA